MQLTIDLVALAAAIPSNSSQKWKKDVLPTK
jgi:hypothetical protein